MGRLRRIRDANDVRHRRGVAEMYRTANVEVTGDICHCGRHYALKIKSTNGTVMRENMCPLAYWLQCQSFLDYDERVKWQKENPSHKDFIVVEQTNHL